MNSTFDIEEHIAKFANNIFLNSGRQKTKFQTFYNQVKNTALNLKEAGINKNAIVLVNVPVESFPVLLFALWLNKVTAFPINQKIPLSQIENHIRESKASFYISEKVFNPETVSAKCLSPGILLKYFPEKKTPNFTELDLLNFATVILTSGSSGTPKYAVHSLANHFSNAHAVNKYFDISERDNWLLALPVFHVAGLAIIIRAFLTGATLSIPANDENIAHALNNYKPTHISLVPTQLQRLLEKETEGNNLQKCKAVFLGGSFIHKTLLKKVKQNNLNIFTSYGLTEMCSTVAIKKITDNRSDHAEVLPIHKVKISAEDEILLKGKSLFKGYLQNDKINTATDQDGWFHSKDLGELDESRKLTVFGRMDNMFISGGENIYPEEIEKYLLEIEGLEQAIVVPTEDKEFGFRPVAFIKSRQMGIREKIMQYLGKHLPSFKIPVAFFAWPQKAFKELKIDRKKFIDYLKNNPDPLL